MTVLAYDITESSLTFIADDGIPRSVDQTHPNYQVIRDHLFNGTADADELVVLADFRTAIQNKTFGLVEVGIDRVTYKGYPIEGYLVDKLMAMLKDGLDIEPWANLLNNLMSNPEQRARERLPLFLTENNMPITKDGYFLGWRLVKEDYWDIHTGHTFHNTPGAVLEQERWRCDSNPEQTCSQGIHVAAFSYLGSYGFNGGGTRCMLVKVNPADVVAVPTDYNNAKLRACKVEVLREVEKELVPALFGRDDHVATEDGFHIEDEESDSDVEEDRLSEWQDDVSAGYTKLSFKEWLAAEGFEDSSY